jgi:hypothetical protein
VPLTSGLEPEGAVQAGEHDRREEDESQRAKQHVASEPVDDEMDPEQADREQEAPIEQDVERCLVAVGGGAGRVPGLTAWCCRSERDKPLCRNDFLTVISGPSRKRTKSSVATGPP